MEMGVYSRRGCIVNRFRYCSPDFVATILAVTGSAKLFSLAPMRARAAHLQFSTRAFRMVGAAEVAATTGLLAGRRRPGLGVASGAAASALMVGACITHLRRGDGLSAIVPAAVVGLAAGHAATVFAGHIR